MEKYRAIPDGYMTVGQIAKKMGITARTLQYYDREGVLAPSAQSEGGRRLYTDKDMVKLHQILSMKYLGFSLEDIKNRLVSLDTPEQVAIALDDNAVAIRQKMDALAESLQAIEVLKAEVLQMETVDFRKYADIIVSLQIKNEMYWAIKYIDNDTMEHLRGRFNKKDAKAMMERISGLLKEATQLGDDGVLPESEKGQELAKVFWGLVLELTGGDTAMMSKLDKMTDKIDLDTGGFIESALEIYFTKSGYNPFEKEESI